MLLCVLIHSNIEITIASEAKLLLLTVKERFNALFLFIRTPFFTLKHEKTFIIFWFSRLIVVS